MYAFFTHGVNVAAETAGGSSVTSPGPLTTVSGIPWTDVLGLPQGFGKTFRGKSNQSVWFHAAIPSPALINAQIVVLRDVMLNVRMDAGCRIDQIHVWDGGINVARLGAAGALRLSGDLTGDFVSNRNRFDVRNADGSYHRIGLGLAVSMLVRFDQEANIRFNAVGASFLSPA
jgi:hypothetical protein